MHGWVVRSHIDYHKIFSCNWSLHKFFLDSFWYELDCSKRSLLKNSISTNLTKFTILEFNEFLIPEYSTDELILYTVLSFFLTNQPSVADVFPELFVAPSALQHPFGAFPAVRSVCDAYS